MVAVRVVSYNVRALRDDAAAVARVLRDLRPDLCCVQEAPRSLCWRRRNARLARKAGLVHAAGGGGSGGTALLVAGRVRVIDVATDRLPRTRGLAQRAVVHAETEVDGVRVGVACVHLGLAAAERARHLPLARSALERRGLAASVLAGDLNEGPGGPVWAGLTGSGAGSYVDACAQAGATGPTFPARDPRARIDGVFVRGPARVLAARVVGGPDVLVASDHRPVCVDLDIGPP